MNIENTVKLECSLVGYEFPENSEDNWLLVRVKVTQGKNIFERVDAALETMDLVRLLQWFTCLSENRLPRYAHVNFTEPCMSLAFLACQENRVRISIELSHELKPNFALEQFRAKHTEWNIVFDLTSHDFEAIIEGIQSAMHHYPIRGKGEDIVGEDAYLSGGNWDA
jgi:hypothetical protein